jgi:hypothetical protein
MHQLPGTRLHRQIRPLLERVQRIFSALCHNGFFVGICYNNYEAILARLNFLTLFSRRWYLDALSLLMHSNEKLVVLPF